jgi:3alpha(or 20beta)-hydroxysteroid dehydrogenase
MPVLQNRIALISGGAQGMGASHVRAFVREGAKVVIGDILDDKGAALAEELGDGVVYQHLDVTKSEDWDAAVTRAQDEFGGLNVLVNNAGIFIPSPLESDARDDWDRVLGINLTGSYLGVVAAKDQLIESAPSSIVNISSTSGLIGTARNHAYVASKFGVRGFTKSVADELGKHNVRANSVHPGPISTTMIDGIDIEQFGLPLGRPGEPEEVSNLVVYLASEASSYSTGSEFVVDGGQTAGTGELTD